MILQANDDEILRYAKRLIKLVERYDIGHYFRKYLLDPDFFQSNTEDFGKFLIDFGKNILIEAGKEAATNIAYDQAKHELFGIIEQMLRQKQLKLQE